MTVPAGTLLGWSAAPGWAGGWGLLDPDDTRDIVKAASQHPATRWCLTFTVEETEPGVIRWTTPAGRTHTTTPTSYDL